MAARPKALSPEALAVLTDDVRVEGLQLFLTGGQLDRKLYVEVNAALDAIGGKWNKKAKAHLFESDPSDALDQITTDGVFHQTKQELDQFFTPAALAKRVVELADVKGRTVLEPSAGDGALVQAAVVAGATDILAVEVDPKHLAKLRDIARARPRVQTQHANFLEMGGVQTGSFDRVVMNPPFSRQRDIAHVLHALKFLAPKGKLVSIMGAGVKFRQDKAAKAFRQKLADNGGTMTDLPEGSFKESGTGVHTVLVVIGA